MRDYGQGLGGFIMLMIVAYMIFGTKGYSPDAISRTTPLAPRCDGSGMCNSKGIEVIYDENLPEDLRNLHSWQKVVFKDENLSVCFRIKNDKYRCD
jgi:hypothetical protein